LSAARLLVVDDEENIATIVSELLRNERYEVDTSLTGADAIERIRTCEYDLVLVDLHMDGIDGLTVLDEVQRSCPMTTTIVITGFATLESAISAMRRGAYDYLIKPCTVDDIKFRIRRGLERRSLMLAERESKAMLQRINSELEARVQESTSELVQANNDLLEASRAKDIFFATLSHELRTPLTPILGWARLLRSGPHEGAFIGRGLEVIERNADLLNNLIGDLLDVSRVISGKFQFNLEPTDLALVVRGVVDEVRDKAAASGLELHCDIASEPIMVNGNRLRLNQILSNLLSNAIKFTEPGGRVSVSLRREQGQARITVSDTGVGIDPEFLPRVFELFTRAPQTGLNKYEGLGVGLSIVKRLTEFQGGTVLAESQGRGQGATLVVGFPCIQQSRLESESDTGLRDIPEQKRSARAVPRTKLSR
jgi:signal transduction histidine kinase